MFVTEFMTPMQHMPATHFFFNLSTFHFTTHLFRSLLLAPASGIDFISEQSDYPLPVGTPISWRVNETGALVNSGQTGVAVVGQWPNPSGFAAWAGCADADPGDLVQTFDFTAGGSSVAGRPGAQAAADGAHR